MVNHSTSNYPHDGDLSLYVHIPFCETKCPYCDFNTYAGIESLMPSYIKALKSEIETWSSVLNKPRLKSIFWGGGTPSYLPTRDISSLMNSITKYFALSDNCEVTLEANPGDCTRERLSAIKKTGFNRISIGVQSLDDHELHLLGRRHSADEALSAISSAHEAGFENINADLIFGLPYQPVSSWEHTLESTITTGVEHISAYCLTLESGTPLELDVKSGKVQEPDSDIGAAMYDLAIELLGSNDFQQYEISNWSKSKKQSTHNLAYWNSDPYLGVGPGAHSYLWPNGMPGLSGIPQTGIRFETIKSPRAYIDNASSWSPSKFANFSSVIEKAPTVETHELLLKKTAVSDFLMMGLRLNSGLSDALFIKRFGSRIKDWIPNALYECIELSLVEWVDDHLRLTAYGRPLANEALKRFMRDLV